jgi:hypothetical protein
MFGVAMSRKRWVRAAKTHYFLPEYRTVLTWYCHPQQVPQAATVAQARRLEGLAQGQAGQELACQELPR